MDRINLPGSSPYFGVATGFSKSFQTFIRDVGEARSKYDEHRAVRKELARVRETGSLPSLSLREKKENMICLIYGHILGHDVSFGYMNAINLAEQAKLVEKRVGYLALSLLLDEDHEMTLLLMNTIRKDLLHKDLIIKSFALGAASRLVSKEKLPFILGTVKDLANHNKEMIRKKAINVLCKFHQLDPNALALDEILQKRLCDVDVGVLGNVMNGLLMLVREDRLRHRSITASVVSIVKQLLEGRIPADFIYYGVPAPWILITSLRVLAELGADDLSCSKEMYEVLGLCFERIVIDTNIGCAVTYECMKTITSIYPDSFMINMVTNRLNSFFLSSMNNMKYIGINMLARLISIDIKYADGYQNTVIDSLNDSDETLKRKTLDLLYQMTNSGNVDVVCSKLLSHLRCTIDSFFRTNLVTRITKLAERFAPDDLWYVKTINEVLEVGGSLVDPTVAFNVMRLFGEGSDDAEEDTFMKQSSLEYYLTVIEKPNIPDVLMQLASWVIGEYSCSSGPYQTDDILERLMNLLKRKRGDPETRAWILSAIIKVHGQVSEVPKHVMNELHKYSGESDSDLRQRCSEAVAIATAKADLSRIVPVDASCEDIDVESSLAFLEEKTEQQVAEGTPSYNPEWRRTQTVTQTDEKIQNVGLNFAPYTYQGPNISAVKEMTASKRISEQPRALEARDSEPTVVGSSKPKLWTSTGYVNKERLDSVSSDPSDSTSEAESAKEDSKETILSDRSITAPATSNYTSIKYHDSERERLKEALFQGSPADTRVKTVRTPKATVSDANIRSVTKTKAPNANTFIQTGNIYSYEKNKAPLLSKDKVKDLLSLDDLLLHDNGLAIHNSSTVNSLEIEANKSPEVRVPEREAMPCAEEQSPVIEPNVLDSEIPTIVGNEVTLEDDTGSPSDVLALSPEVTSLNESGSMHRQPFASDENIRISLIKEEKPTELELLLFITNQTPDKLSKVTFSVKAMSNLNFKLEDGSDLSITYDVISPRRTIQSRLSVLYKSPLQNVTITAEITYRDKAFNKKLLIGKHELSYLELIRPSRMDAGEFQNRWLKIGLLELSRTFETPGRKPAHILEAITSNGHIQIVDTDKQGTEIEILAAGSILGKVSLLFYIHVNVKSTKILIRSDNNQLNECVLKSLQVLMF